MGMEINEISVGNAHHGNLEYLHNWRLPVPQEISSIGLFWGFVFFWYPSVNCQNCTTLPPTVSPIGYCQNAPAVLLTAVGENLLWYSSATVPMGMPETPTPYTGTVGTITFYVSQTVNGCESPRVPLVVTVFLLVTVVPL